MPTTPASLATLNYQLAQKLTSIRVEAPYLAAPYVQGHKMQQCVHPLDGFSETANYCRCALCLLCRRWRASRKRRQLTQLLGAALDLVPFFQTFTLSDCEPAEVRAQADLLVNGFKKLLRKRGLRHVCGWARAIEVKTATPYDDLENVHLHAILLLPNGSAEDVNQTDWDVLWQLCAGNLARDTHVSVARSRQAVVGYLTKSSDGDFREDAEIGIEDPLRYVRRVLHGHTKFSSGGKLRPHVP